MVTCKYNVTYAGKPKTPARGIVILGQLGTRCRNRLPEPNSWARITINTEECWGKFVRIALNVVKRVPDDSRSFPNLLPEILREWFGDEGILPGEPFCHVTIEPVDPTKPEKGYAMEPA